MTQINGKINVYLYLQHSWTHLDTGAQKKSVSIRNKY